MNVKNVLIKKYVHSQQSLWNKILLGQEDKDNFRNLSIFCINQITKYKIISKNLLNASIWNRQQKNIGRVLQKKIIC
jgi:hypothetical protein